MNRRALAVLVAVLAGCATPTVAPARAAPDDGSISLSTDGRSWGAGIGAPLFPPEVRWVPGDVRTATFYVANHGPTAARVVLALDRTEDELVGPGDVVLEARLAGERWLRLEAAASGAVLNRVLALRAEDSSRIDLRATFRPGAGNRSRSASVRLAFVVELRQALAAAGARDLPGTGAHALWLPGALGVLLLAAGAVLLGRASSRRAEGRR